MLPRKQTIKRLCVRLENKEAVPVIGIQYLNENVFQRSAEAVVKWDWKINHLFIATCVLATTARWLNAGTSRTGGSDPGVIGGTAGAWQNPTKYNSRFYLNKCQRNFDERPHRSGDFSFGKINVTLDCFFGLPIGTLVDSIRENPDVITSQ